MSSSSTEWKTVVVLGAAYGGARAAQVLAAGLPASWRVILVDRNSHANHVYILPRLAVLPGHEHKAFVPYTNIFMLDKPSQHIFLQAHVVALAQNHVVLSQSFPEHGIPTTRLSFDYAVYALGSTLPAPLDLWNKDPLDMEMKERTSTSIPYTGTKSEAIAWLKRCQSVIEQVSSIAIVGGGALGVQYATDIAAVHPEKQITLIHSRTRLLPRFEEEMHFEILKSLEGSNVDVILGERLDMSSVREESRKVNQAGQRVIRTLKGREVAADLIMLCTGQAPNTFFLRDMDKRTVDPESQLAHVLPTLQLAVRPQTQADSVQLEEKLEKLSVIDNSTITASVVEESTPYPNIFVVGDAADAFGAVKAGHNAYFQAQVAARNILKLIESDTELEKYTPGQPAIKVSLGLSKSVYQVNGAVGVTNDGQDDLGAAAVWPFFGMKVDNEDDMYL